MMWKRLLDAIREEMERRPARPVSLREPLVRTDDPDQEDESPRVRVEDDDGEPD